MLVVGDVMLDRRVGARMAEEDDYTLPFRHVDRRLRRADITLANFESALAREGPPTQSDAFAADPRALRGLLHAGVDVVSLANNHTGDFGPRSLRTTLRLFREAEIPTVGAGRDLRRARRPEVIERNGVRFGFLAFNAIGETPGATADAPGAVQIRMQPRTGPLNTTDLDRFLDDVRTLTQEADVVIVYAHWGANYTRDVHPDQRRVGRAIVRAGADVVVGTHPHWIQRIETYRGAPIAYSLGNFIFDMDFSRQTMEGIVLRLRFRGDELVNVRPLPIQIDPQDWAPRFVDD